MNEINFAMVQIGIMAGITILLRVLPFLVFREKKTPAIVTYLGNCLPYAIMGMLIVYCLKGVSLMTSPHGIPEILASLLVAILHGWKRNTLVSIIGGTLCYMILIRIFV